MAIADEKYVALTTFTRDGREKSTPVWIAGLSDGRVGFSTEVASWKVRRIGHDPRVRLQSCDMRGRVVHGSEAVDGIAEVLAAGDDGFPEVSDRIAAKYGLTAKAVRIQSMLQGLVGRSRPERAAIVIDLDSD